MSSEQLAAQRLAEAPVIEAEWAAMSYKDRASWWMSAKWYGYMSTEAYRRGDAPANANESCRYGEPGFFIATRVPYYEAPAAPSVPSDPVAPVEVPTAVVEALSIPTKPAEVVEPILPSESPSTPVVAAATNDAGANGEETTRNAIVGSIDKNNTPLLAAVIEPKAAQTNAPGQKKKKKNKHGTAGVGKTIQIHVGSRGIE